MRLRLHEFIQAKYKTDDLAFGQLTEQFIYDFQNYITDETGKQITTAICYLTLLKKACRMAFKDGCTDKPYFAHFRLPQKKATTPKALSREQFEALRDMEIEESRPQHRYARDLFLFACYTGVPYGDAVTITSDNLVRNGKGDLWLRYNRVKNGIPASVKILPEALELIAKYHDDNRDTLFPYRPNWSIDMYSLEMVIRLAYAIDSHKFRQYIMNRLMGRPMYENVCITLELSPR